MNEPQLSPVAMKSNAGRACGRLWALRLGEYQDLAKLERTLEKTPDWQTLEDKLPAIVATCFRRSQRDFWRGYESHGKPSHDFVVGWVAGVLEIRREADSD